ncbi:MAG: FKBP-type peptidyl-prolyl cis-trans isomerase N-terminal domain-containing protein [Lysobacteraceae bacterium]
MKVRLGIALLAMMGTGVVLAQDTTSEKGKLSYAVGYEIGKDFTERKIDIDVNTVIRAIQDGYGKRPPAVAEEQMRAALEQMQTKMVAEARAEFEKVARENKTKSDQFLAQNRGKSGIVALPSGLQYRVIEEGTGGRPAASSQVKVHFRGSLYSGQEFANTYQGASPQPLTMRVSEAPLQGLQDALPLMKAGSRWELYLPAELAYGDSPRSPVGPNQAVVFDVRLVEVN